MERDDLLSRVLMQRNKKQKLIKIFYNFYFILVLFNINYLYINHLILYCNFGQVKLMKMCLSIKSSLSSSLPADGYYS